METVGELIKKLQELDPQMPCLVDGYEGGYITPIIKVENVLEVGHRAYMGPFETAENAHWLVEEGAAPFQALILSRCP